MNPQDDTAGGAEEGAGKLPQMTIETNRSPNRKDEEGNWEGSEGDTIHGRVHDDADQLGIYATNVKDAKETQAQEAHLDTIVQPASSQAKRHPTFVDDDHQSYQESNISKEDTPVLPNQTLTGPNPSLEQLQRSPQTWQKIEISKVAQIPLPPSEASSTLSTHSIAGRPLPSGQSLENLELRPENIALPSRKKANPLLNWMAGPAASKARKRNRRKEDAHPDPPSIVNEVEHYRNNVDRLADHFAYFDNVASVDTRHNWSSRIVLYDRLASEHHQSPSRYEPWPNQASAPPYSEFYSTLRTVADNCEQRVVLIEDLSPSLVDLLGATFDIPPHVFEEHLDRSGYKTMVESHKTASAWNPRSSAQGYSSVTWYRPVLPLLPLNSNFRARLIKNRSPKVLCPLEGCEQHRIPLGTTGNIWRHYIELCPEPGDYHKGSGTEYPVGWEERATVWTQDFDGCKFVVILLDPLPVVMVKQEKIGASRRGRLIPMGVRWIENEEGAYKERRLLHARQHVLDWADQPSLPVHSEDWLPAPALPHPVRPGPTSTGIIEPQSTGTDLDPGQAAFIPTALRRRATKSDREQPGTGAFDANFTSLGNNKQDTGKLDHHSHIAPPPPPPPAPPSTMGRRLRGPAPSPAPPLPPPSLLSQTADQELANTKHHGPFVPYDLIKARSSSSARNDATFVTKHMRAYIESLQIPKSTLEEFDHFLQAPARGKETQYDPFHALFRAIHDDSHSLVDIIRISLHQIREGTLDEDLMQRRVTFWRALLHRLNFNLGELDQNLRAFVRFINEPEAHTSRAPLPSEKLAEDTRFTLGNCMDLIDRSSHSLLAEMQIVDSRRSIAEAESVSKLTELAFVFVPLSFVASLFSMQVHELDGGVPLYQFALVAIGFVIVAYIVRLGIRSSHLIEYKNNAISRIREEADLQHNEPIPTHKFLSWFGSVLSAGITRKTTNFVTVLAPFTLVTATLAAMLSPIVLLWLRKMDKGFTAVMTVLLLLLDVILVIPILTQISDRIVLNPQEHIREIKRIREMNRKKRDKAKRERRRTAGEDPEQVGGDGSSNSSEE